MRPPREQKKEYQSDRPPNPPATTLWVGNLSFDIAEDGLWEIFGEHGAVASVRLPTDRETGAPKGFAYVEFADQDGATKALGAMNGNDIAGRNCRIVSQVSSSFPFFSTSGSIILFETSP